MCGEIEDDKQFAAAAFDEIHGLAGGICLGDDRVRRDLRQNGPERVPDERVIVYQ